MVVGFIGLGGMVVDRVGDTVGVICGKTNYVAEDV